MIVGQEEWQGMPGQTYTSCAGGEQCQIDELPYFPRKGGVRINTGHEEIMVIP